MSSYISKLGSISKSRIDTKEILARIKGHYSVIKYISIFYQPYSNIRRERLNGK